jgi:hypothetical protein
MNAKRWTYQQETPEERMLKSMRLWLRRAMLDQDERAERVAVARLAFVVRYPDPEVTHATRRSS